MTNLTPGRKLDALVAEKVMGFPGEVIRGLSYPNCPRHYSTDIAAAWEVVEKLREKGLAFEVFFGWESGKKFQRDNWVSEFTDVASEYTGVADTAPHAICLAALGAAQ